MNRHILFACATGAALAATASAQFTQQITYVDANPLTNTTLADGTPFTPATAEASDNNWTERSTGASNGGTVFQANGPGVAAGGEDAVMLRTTMSGLIPGLPYNTYAYFWGHGAYNWSGRAQVASSQPAPPLPGYETNHVTGSPQAPMQPLALGCFEGDEQTTLGLNFDPAFLEIDGHFEPSVKITDGTGYLFEIPLGVQTADANGEIHVYIDDLEFGDHATRTWYDGVGYEVAPLTFGNACGTAQIGMTGVPTRLTNFSIDLTGGVPNSLAVALVGLQSLQPFDIGAIGFTPGCYLNVDFALLHPALTDANGDAAYAGNFASLPTTAALPVYWQWAVFDPALAVDSMSPGLATWFHY